MNQPSLLLTQGDPAGIGPELALKAWIVREEQALPPFAVVSDPAFLERVAQSQGWNVPVTAVETAQVPDVFP
ncbi:MAG: 4-hydroxythreonine-4-phosphate dehydrogenase PdxA, partial [Microvirga sp.]|nr:4-hydroxythreonine-4-phosphate dehydrogenase PdxA [Microvirga sp.]